MNAHTTHLRLTTSDEVEVERKIKAGKATLLEESLAGEVLALRHAIDGYWRRLAVAYPSQAGDLYMEAHRITHPDLYQRQTPTLTDVRAALDGGQS